MVFSGTKAICFNDCHAALVVTQGTKLPDVIKWISYILLIGTGLVGRAQDSELSFEEQLAQLDLEMDSLSIFSFLDSLLNATELKSEIGIRLGYTSSRLTAGRDFNTQQKGFSPGISYFHKSGAYVDFTSFFDNQSDPALNQSTLHAGYLWIPHQKWTINPYIEKTFNNQDFEYDLTQSLGSNVSYDFKLVEVSLDYSFLWGKKTGQRFIGSLNKKIVLTNVPLVDKLTFYPTISTIAGTADIFSYLYSSLQLNLLEIQHLTDDEIRTLRVNGKITTEEAIQLRVARRLLNEGTDLDRASAISLINGSNLSSLQTNNTFALLSYSFSLPISFNISPKTSVMLSYSYSVPLKLPGEDLGVDPTGFFSFSMSRRITW